MGKELEQSIEKFGRTVKRNEEKVSDLHGVFIF